MFIPKYSFVHVVYADFINIDLFCLYIVQLSIAVTVIMIV